MTSQWRPCPEWTHLESWWIFHWDPPLSLPWKRPMWLSLWSMLVPFPTLFPQVSFPCLALSPKLQGLFFSLCNLFPEPISSTAHFFYLCDFLNKLFLIVWVLALNSFLTRTRVQRLLNQGLVWLYQSNTWCHFANSTTINGTYVEAY